LICFRFDLLGVPFVCAGIITLLVIIYKGHSPSLVRARSQEGLEAIFARALCYTGLIGASCEAKSVTGLTGHHHRSDRWTLTVQVFGGRKI
jgi:hypothetical protein